jgi:hypothetical protein
MVKEIAVGVIVLAIGSAGGWLLHNRASLRQQVCQHDWEVRPGITDMGPNVIFPPQPDLCRKCGKTR